MPAPAGNYTPTGRYFQATVTAKDILKPLPPTQYIVDNLFSLPSLNIVYGAPSTLKSMLLADMAVCVAMGRSWLEPSDIDAVTEPIAVTQSPVYWLDFDNGRLRTIKRLAAFMRRYKALEDTPLNVLNGTVQPYDANNLNDNRELEATIGALGAKLVIIDNLAAISGGKDENTIELGWMMSNLRMISEITGAAIVIIHHARKQTFNRGSLGDDLRGHSSIRAAIDTAILVTRESGTNQVTLQATKARDAEFESMSAMFVYTHYAYSKDLDTATFEGMQSPINIDLREIEDAIIDAVMTNSAGLNQRMIIEILKKKDPETGKNKIRSIIHKLVADQRIKEKPGPGTSILYTA